MRRHGGARDVASQALRKPAQPGLDRFALVVCLLAGLSSGCRPAPDGPRPPRIPAERAALEAASLVPEPGMELRHPMDRAAFDIAHYRLELDLSRPASGEFSAVATLTGDLAAGADRVDLDFIGLEIAAVTLDGRAVEFGRGGSVLTVGPFDPSPSAAEREIRIEYGGAPENGLFFGEDRDGEPAVFADNWPNRARWWFPSNDHPLDKATVRFEVLAPEAYEVIANGRLVERRPGPGAGGRRRGVREAFERASGRKFGWFFDQWVHGPGHPQLDVEWGPEAEDLVLTIRQVQPAEWPVFTLDLDFEVEGGGAAGRRASVRVDAREATLRIPGAAGAEALRFDPDVSVLATAELRRR